MRSKIRLDLPGDWGDEVISSFFKAIDFELGHEIEGAMDLDVSDLDERAWVYEKRIREVELTKDSIFITYELAYDAYHGCRDINYSDTDERHMSGARQGNTFYFDEYIPPPRRTTFEEF